MPKLSYPGGRQAAARVEEPKLKSNSVKLTDGSGPNLVDMLEKEEQIDPQEEVVASQDEASIAFQKQIDALKESERIQRERAEQFSKEREEAIKRANEREVEIHSLKRTTIDSQVGEVAAGLAAATAESESAQRDLEKAFELGDFKGQAEATNRLSRANTSIAQLEHGKAELETQAKAAAEAKVETVANDPLERLNLPTLAKGYLRKHPELLTDPRKNAKIQSLHWDIIDEGHAPYSQEYFVSMDEHLGYREKPRTNSEQEEEVTRMVSAPPSREVPSSSGDRGSRVTLSVAQKEAAKIAGVTEKEYAENLLKLRAEKLNGNYGGAP